MAVNTRGVPRSTADELVSAQLPTPTAVTSLKEPRKGAPRSLGRQTNTTCPEVAEIPPYPRINRNCGPSPLCVKAQGYPIWALRERLAWSSDSS